MPEPENISDPSEAAKQQVRRLLLSGDNTLKNRREDARYARARDRYRQAREVAVGAGLDASVVAIIDRRLMDLTGDEAADGARTG
jgi:hypothetical protein